VTALPAERLRVTYQLSCGPGEAPEARARDIAVEQTVELPLQCVPREIAARFVGQIEAIEPLGDGRWHVVIAYDPIVLDDAVPQLVNLLFGNISLKPPVLVTAIDWPPSLLARLGGPRWGIEGVRALVGGEAQRPLLCTALKPLGLSAVELAHLCYRFALGGIDIIKDDHNLANQATAPFRERVERCQEAIAKANRESGGSSRYFPNLGVGSPALAEHIAFVRTAGCRGVLLSPLILGLDAVHWIAATAELAILAHPSLSGVWFRPDHGIVPELLYGEIYRAVGCDGVIYTNVGGRFDFPEAACHAINANLRKPLGLLRPAFPVPGGGVDVQRVRHWIDRYGIDTILLIGGSLYAQGDLTAASRRLLDTVRAHCQERLVKEAGG
jgi:ribulose-bisphosphate carboxylase large chain